MKTRDQEMFEDAEEAGFTIINGLIFSPPACDLLQAFRTLRIIWENRGINQINPQDDTITVQRMKMDAYNAGLEIIANEYDDLIRHMDAGGDFFEFQKAHAIKATKE